MNLAPVAGLTTRGHRIFGLSLLHFFVMLALSAFFVAMVWMYFFKMRRAARLLRHLDGAQTMSSTADAAHIGSPASLTAGVAPSVAPLTPTVPGPAPPAPFQKAAGGSTGSEVTAAAGARASAPWTGQLRVAGIFDETPTVKTYRLANPGGGDLLFTFEPGQFMTVALTVQGKLTRRPYSIASSPCCRGWCEISVKHAPSGLVSGYLHEHVREGDLLDVVAPSGRFTFRGVEASSVVFIAGGIGITPLMSAVRYLTDQSWQGEIHLLYACARMEEVIFREELDLLQRRHANLYPTITLSHEDSAAWTGQRGFITKELLTKTVPALTSRRVHLCGSPRMLDAVKALLTELGVPAGQVYTEIFLGPVAGRAPAAPPAEKVLGGLPIQAPKTAVCTFVRSRKTAALPPNKTVLEASEEVGVNIDYSCREGYCATCKVRLLAGEATMAVEDALTPEDKGAHIILACQAKSKADVSIDA